MKQFLSRLLFWRRLKKVNRLTFFTFIGLIWLIGLIGLIYTLKHPKGAEAAWMDDNWAYREAVSFGNTGSADSNKKVKFDIDTTAAPDKFQADCGDVRFTDASGQLLKYYFDSAGGACDTASSDFYVLMPTILSGSNLLYMYYGNPSVVNGTEAAQFSQATFSPTSGPSVASEEKAVGPYAYWRFDDGTGTTTQDSSSNDKDTTLASSPNTPSWQTEDMCVSGKCLYFDGAGDYASATSIDLSNTDVITVEFWMRWNAFANNDALALEFTNNHNNFTTGFFVDPNESVSGKFQIDVKGNIGNNSAEFTRPSENEWHHYAFIYDKSATSNEVIPYVDGKAVAYTKLYSSNNTNNFGNDTLYFMSRGGASLPAKGFLDNVRIYKYALSAAQVKADFNKGSGNEGQAARFGTDPNNLPNALSNGLVGFWKMDEASWNGTAGEVVDASGNGNNGTAYTSTTTAGAKFGNGGNPDGINEGVNLGDDTDFELTTLTVAAWVYRTGTCFAFTQCTIFSKGMSANTGYALMAKGANSNKPSLGIRDGLQAEVVATTSLSTNTWYHVAASIDGSRVKVYVNGVLEADEAQTQTPNFGAEVAKIGNANSNNDLAFEGKIDDMRVYNRVLSPAEITQLYTFAPGPVGYWKMEEGTGTSATDISGNANTGTITAGTGGWTNGKYGKSYSFDKASTKIDSGSGATLDDLKNTAGLTAEAWIYPKSVGEDSTNGGLIIGKATGPSPNPTNGWLFHMSSGSVLRFVSDGSTDLVRLSSSTVSLNTWNHVAVSWDGSTTATNSHIYINGVEVSYTTSTNGVSLTSDATPTLVIGNDSTSANTFDGSIDDIRVYNYPRSQKQVVEDMNAGHPAPGSPVGSPVGWWKFDEGADNLCPGGTNDACNSGSDGNNINGAQSNMASPATAASGWTQSGKFGRALRFDGTDDVVTITNVNSIDFDTNLVNHSFTAWIYADTAGESNVGQIYNKGTNTYLRTDNPSGSNLDIEANLDLATTDANVNVSAPITTTTWHHLAVTWDGTTLRVYIDGLQRGSGTGSGAIVADSNNLLIGGATTANFDGTIDEPKIYNYALTNDELKMDMNRSAQTVMGALSKNSTYQPNAAANEYCVPQEINFACTENPPVAEWKMEEHTGTTISDTSGNANTSSAFTGNVTWTEGKIGTGLNFDGNNSVVRIPETSSTDLGATTDSYTVSTWIKTSTNPAVLAIIFAKETGSAFPYELIIQSNGIPLFRISDGTFTVAPGGNTSISNGKWHYLTGVRNVTADIVSIYVDGVLAKSQNDTTTTTTANNDDVSIGNGGTSYTQWDFTGQIDQVRIYNYARTAAQIAWDYNQGKPVAQYKADECAGTTLNDSSGNLYSQTITIGGSGTTAVGTCTTSSSAWGGSAGDSTTNSGKYNYALTLDGTDDYASTSGTIINSASQTTYKTVSWGGWFNPVTGVASKTLLEKNREFRLTTDSSSQPNCSIWTAGAWSTAAVGSSALSTSSWQQVLCVYDGSSIYAYVNGVLPGTTSQTASITSLNYTPLTSGHNFGGSQYFQGRIDALRVYNYALTAAQVKTLYNQGAATRFGPSTGSP